MESIMNYDQFRQECLEFRAKHGHNTLEGILTKHAGTNDMGDVDPDDFEKVADAFKAADRNGTGARAALDPESIWAKRHERERGTSSMPKPDLDPERIFAKWNDRRCIATTGRVDGGGEAYHPSHDNE
jgi:hypothetical protein